MGRRDGIATTAARSTKTMLGVVFMLAGCAASGPDSQTTPALGPVPAPAPPASLAESDAAAFAALALACIHRPYPNKVAHVLAGDDDAKPPRALTPAFYGCFDWHSAVHGHWLLVRLVRLHPRASFAARARAALGQSLSVANLEAETRYVARDDRNGFERPYGLAWLLALATELREWDDPDARRWAEAVAPLEGLAATRLRTWLPKLTHPIRSGEHSQSAFALGLALDWARSVGDQGAQRDFVVAATTLYRSDRECPLSYEPSGHDFLSPCLAEADLMRRVSTPAEFGRWLDAFLPGIPGDGRDDWLSPPVPRDRTDGKLVHLDGLNLSRAWMLEGIAAGLPDGDRRRAALVGAARRHAEAGLGAVTGGDYAGGHWLASFATYLTTRRGLGR